MNVLHVVAGELSGGAARGAYWLHRGLRDIGVNSWVFTNSEATYGDPSVVTVTRSKRDKLATFVRNQTDGQMASFYRRRTPAMFSTGLLGVDFTKTPEYQAADLVHLHWINAGFVNMRHLAKVEKPMVWTLRDMWPMTGGCHYAMGCERFRTGCGQCPALGSRAERDFSRYILRRKARYLPRSMHLVGISHWVSEQARASLLFRDFDVRTISNNVDAHEFFPIDKAVARELLGLHTDKKVILTGSTSAKDAYKGFPKFIESLAHLDPARYHLCFFGKLDRSLVDGLGFDYTSLGYLHDSISLRLAYSAADVFIAPSLMEAFGKTLTESMACGTPVVCFDATGPKDIVSHLADGYKAPPFEASGLAEGVEWVCNHPDYPALSRGAREKVLREFDSPVVARQYLALYQEALTETETSPAGDRASEPTPSQPPFANWTNR